MKRNPITIAVGALLLTIFFLLLFLFQVRTTELAVVATFGRVTAHAGPGAHFRWPWPIQSVHKFDQRIHTFEGKLEQVLTSDANNLLIMVYVGWQINDPAVFLTRFNGSTNRAQDSLEGLIRNAYSGVVGKHPLTHFISTDEKQLKFVEIEQEMQARIQADCRALTNGLNIAFLGIKRLGLPESVTKLVFERMESEREVRVSEVKGDGERQASEIRSRADFASAKLLAEAEAEATKTQGEGEKIAAKSFEVFRQEPELAKLLLDLKALEQLLQERATLILHDDMAPLNILKSKEPAGPQK
ncbi:MAG TPA: SPFH domain-containing protein [Verrucomicrobiae bacterium]|jgi:membrane protease subunit HflC|nr:SPFH domain-containing protein [Verrucomicrobiae bacterium]